MSAPLVVFSAASAQPNARRRGQSRPPRGRVICLDHVAERTAGLRGDYTFAVGLAEVLGPA